MEITKATPIAAGTTEPNPYGPGHSAPLPAYCRVEGVINRRIGVGGEEFGINFALAMPDHWNSDFLMQGGGGGNGVVLPPLGLVAAGDTPGLMRGFAVVSTDTGHKSHGGAFDFGFMKDEQAYLDFAYLANAQVAALAKELIAQYYAKPPAHSYFSGCSTGGREGMILSQRYPDGFRRYHLRRSGHAYRAFQSGHRKVDTHCLQPGRAEGREWETNHRAVHHRQ